MYKVIDKFSYVVNERKKRYPPFALLYFFIRMIDYFGCCEDRLLRLVVLLFDTRARYFRRI